MSKKTPQELDAMARELEAHGYHVKRGVEYVKTGVAIERSVLERLRRCTALKKMKTQDAINQALTQWLDSCETLGDIAAGNNKK